MNGFPVLTRGLESSVPGLHFLGKPAAWSFGPLLGFVSGAEFASTELTRCHHREQWKQVMSTLSKTVPVSRTVMPARHALGAVVIGGDYQGLGIVRSLGQRGTGLRC